MVYTPATSQYNKMLSVLSHKYIWDRQHILKEEVSDSEGENGIKRSFIEEVTFESGIDK